MLRVRDRWVILLDALGGELMGRAGDHHLTTDPACVNYRAPRPGSRLDRASRGHSCGRCMADAAFGVVPWAANDHDPATPICTCTSGDGSLRWPCRVHPPTTPDHLIGS